MENELYVVALIQSSERAREAVGEVMGNLATRDLLAELAQPGRAGAGDRLAELAMRIQARFVPPALPSAFTESQLRQLVDPRTLPVLAAVLGCAETDVLAALLDSHQLARTLDAAGNTKAGIDDSELLLLKLLGRLPQLRARFGLEAADWDWFIEDQGWLTPAATDRLATVARQRRWPDDTGPARILAGVLTAGLGREPVPGDIVQFDALALSEVQRRVSIIAEQLRAAAVEYAKDAAHLAPDLSSVAQLPAWIELYELNSVARGLERFFLHGSDQSSPGETAGERPLNTSSPLSPGLAGRLRAALRSYAPETVQCIVLTGQRQPITVPPPWHEYLAAALPFEALPDDTSLPDVADVVQALRDSVSPTRRVEEVAAMPTPDRSDDDRRPGDVTYLRKQVKDISTYHVYRGAGRQEAMTFLREVPVKDEHTYNIVETPQGNFGRDLIVIFNEADGSSIELVPRPRTNVPVPSPTRCASCGYFVVTNKVPVNDQIVGDLHVYYTHDELRQLVDRGGGFRCERCSLLQCAVCSGLAAPGSPVADLACGSCGGQLSVHKEIRAPIIQRQSPAGGRESCTLDGDMVVLPADPQGHELWGLAPLRVPWDVNVTEFLASSSLPYLWPDDARYMRYITGSKYAQQMLRDSWVNVFLHHPNPNVVLQCIRDVPPDGTILTDNSFADLLASPGAAPGVREETAGYIWRFGEARIRFIIKALTSRGIISSIYETQAVHTGMLALRAACPPDKMAWLNSELAGDDDDEEED